MSLTKHYSLDSEESEIEFKSSWRQCSGSHLALSVRHDEKKTDVTLNSDNESLL